MAFYNEKKDGDSVFLSEIYTNATAQGFESIAVLTGFDSGANALAVYNGLKKDGAAIRNAYASDGEYFIEVVFDSLFIKLFDIDGVAKKGEGGECVYRKIEAYGDKLYYFDGNYFYTKFDYIGD